MIRISSGLIELLCKSSNLRAGFDATKKTQPQQQAKSPATNEGTNNPHRHWHWRKLPSAECDTDRCGIKIGKYDTDDKDEYQKKSGQ